MFRCYHEDLENLTSSDLRLIYANVTYKSCTQLERVVNGTGIAAKSGQCDDWIFMREQGYESITTEVLKCLIRNLTCHIAYCS